VTYAEREIENLIYHYAELIDAGDLSAVAELFRHACIIAPDGGEVRGFDAVLAMYQQSTRIYPDTGTPCTQHLTSNVQIELAADATTAASRSCFTVFQSVADFPLQAIISGRYVDHFECVAGSWRFSRRQMLPQLFGDLSHHLLFDPATIR
jgi:3-phenylpropionate/cinnamic acid dioxygenase small subunit